MQSGMLWGSLSHIHHLEIIVKHADELFGRERNQKYEINIHLENKMPPDPLACRILGNNRKSVNNTGIYLRN